MNAPQKDISPLETVLFPYKGDKCFARLSIAQQTYTLFWDFILKMNKAFLELFN